MLCFFHQVVRDGRSRDKDASEPCTVQEKNDWQTLAVEYFRTEPGENLTAKRRRVKSARVVAPRLASLDQARALQNALYAGTGEGLQQFENVATLDELEEKFPEDEVRAPADLPDAPRSMTISGDEDATQWSVFNFLLWKLCLCMWPLNDVFHRSYNDIKLAVRRAGLWSAYVHSIVYYNISYGPWQNCSWFHQMVDEAGVLSSRCGPSDPLLLKLWPEICLDRHFCGQGIDNSLVGAAARSKYLKDLFLEKPFVIKGPKCAVARFWSWHEAYAAWDEFHHTKALGMCSLCIGRGWSNSWEDLWTPIPVINVEQEKAVVVAAAIDEAVRGGPANSAAAGSSSSSSSGTVGPLPVGRDHLSEGSQAKDTAKARKEANQKRERSANTLHTATRLMCDRDLTMNVRFIGLGSKAGWTEYNNMCKKVKGAADCRAWFVSWSQGSWLLTLKKTFRSGEDFVGLARAGFMCDFGSSALRSLTRTSPEVQVEDHRACTFWKFILEYVAQRIGLPHYIPLSAMGLIWDSLRLRHSRGLC